MAGIHIHFFIKVISRASKPDDTLARAKLGLPNKNCKIMRHFQGRLSGKREQLCGRLCDFFKANFELDF